MSVVRVGGRSWSSDEASAFVKRYLTTPRENWAYPAYDAYPGAPTDLVGPQDLFAPELLNAGLSLRAYYAFLDALEEVNERLAHVPTAVDLATAKPDDIAAVAHVIGVLDHPRIAGVKLTKLSKVLHRKRPRIFPLYDEHIRRCYQDGPGAPVPPAKDRLWESFATLWLEAVRVDLSTQTESWEELAALTPAAGPSITPLRALDIVGWRLGGPFGVGSVAIEPPAGD